MIVLHRVSDFYNYVCNYLHYRLYLTSTKVDVRSSAIELLTSVLEPLCTRQLLSADDGRW